ncbi:MAG: OmpA family protein [Lacibacter sp.]
MTRIWMIVTFAALLLTSCKNMNKTQKGAVIGTAGGAAMGAVVGRAAGNTAMGTIIGAAVGGTAGVIIGRQMDKQAEEIRRTVPNAKVERVGEGIDIEFESKVLFDFNRWDLKEASRRSLTDLASILNKYPDTNIEIQGHTDNIGSAAANDRISLRRATAVRDFLVQQGVAASRMTVKGMGKNFPKYSNDTEEGRAQNRRVEFLITANEKMRSDAEKEASGNNNR